MNMSRDNGKNYLGLAHCDKSEGKTNKI